MRKSVRSLFYLGTDVPRCCPILCRSNKTLLADSDVPSTRVKIPTWYIGFYFAQTTIIIKLLKYRIYLLYRGTNETETAHGTQKEKQLSFIGRPKNLYYAQKSTQYVLPWY